MDSSRIKQVNALVQAKLSPIVQEYVNDHMVTITRVETSSDLWHTKVNISVLGDDQNVVDQLNYKAKDIRSELAREIKLRCTPMIHFVLDLNEKYAEKMDKIFKKI
jgi:ribosome-binding factor A